MHQRHHSSSSEGILSILAVPKAPGRIYIEASTTTSLRSLLKGVKNLYNTSLFVVPIPECVALLENGPLPSAVKEGDHVKIRNGLYRGDVGEVVRVDKDGGFVVKLEPREPSPFENTDFKKRKRDKNRRREPYVLDMARLIAIAEAEKAAISSGRRVADPKHDVLANLRKSPENGDVWFFRSKMYSVDGYILLRFRPDRVERALRDADHSVQTLDNMHRIGRIDKYMHRILSDFLRNRPSPQACVWHANEPDFRIPKFIRVGNVVRIRAGTHTGRMGVVVETTSSESAVVHLGSYNPELGSSASVQISLAEMDRAFGIRDRVEVKFGNLKGMTGYVYALSEHDVHIVNPDDNTCVRVIFHLCSVLSNSSCSGARPRCIPR